MFKNYSEGSDLTLLNTLYRKRQKNEDGEYEKDILTIVARDNKTGQKIKEEIEQPDYIYFKANDDVSIDQNSTLLFIEVDKVHPVKVPFVDLEKSIAEETGNLDLFYENIRCGNRYENRKLHLHNRIFWSDTDIQDHYRFRFGNTFKNDMYAPEKCYLDIEARSRLAASDFPMMGECPIDAVSIICQKQKQVFTLILRDKENPQIDEFEKEYASGKINAEVKEFVMDQIKDKKKAHLMYKVDELQYNMLFYDEEEEIKLIADIFAIINNYKPDFVLAWNMAFDVPYIMERIVALGYNPEDIICHPDFIHKNCYYFIDERNKNDIPERKDYANISSYSVFLDQMVQFASRRKGQALFPSYSLDYIGEHFVGVNKYDYHSICNKLTDLAMVNFKMYIFYNIFDTIVQKCIEDNANDVDYVFNSSLCNNTRYAAIHRQTVYLTNRFCKECLNMGLIASNNGNRYNSKPNEKFAGAFVADPKYITDYAKLRLHGNPINVYDNLVDFDYARLYPSTIQENNMGSNTQIGKIIIDEPVHDNDNRFERDKYNRGGQMTEDFISGNILEFCTRWLHMASYGELIDDIIEYSNIICNIGLGRNAINRAEHGRPILFYDRNTVRRAVEFQEELDKEMKEKLKYE